MNCNILSLLLDIQTIYGIIELSLRRFFNEVQQHRFSVTVLFDNYPICGVIVFFYTFVHFLYLEKG